VDQSVQGQGLGEMLLVNALDRARRLSSQLGVYAVEVHAIDEKARSFYEKYGFGPLEGLPLDLYLPLETYGNAEPK
jgi:GNAT superfamily N-acetyltransferase